MLEADQVSAVKTAESENCRVYATPAQDSLKAKISLLEKQLIAAIEARDSGLSKSDIQKDIDKLRKEIQDCRKLLTSKEGNAKRSKKYRDEARELLKKIKTEAPDLAKAIHVN